MKRTPSIDYREFRLSKLGSREFCHLKLLLFWPIFGLLFFSLERVIPRSGYYVMYCPLDEYLPFCEVFVIPYFFWFLFIIGMHLYTLLYDVETFRKMMYYFILTYGAALVIYVVFPNCQEFRPTTFPRDNWMVDVARWLYDFDTNTNVCPSLHVIGSAAVMTAAWNSRDFSTRGWRAAFAVAAFVISISTVFLRQHSILDLLAAIPICVGAYVPVYLKKARKSGGAVKVRH